MACTEAGEANHVNNSQRWCKGSTQMRVLGRELSSCIRRCKSMKHDLHSPWGLFSCHSWNHAARTASWTATEKLTEQGGLQIKSNRPWKKKTIEPAFLNHFLPIWTPSLNCFRCFVLCSKNLAQPTGLISTELSFGGDPHGGSAASLELLASTNALQQLLVQLTSEPLGCELRGILWNRQHEIHLHYGFMEGLGKFSSKTTIMKIFQHYIWWQQLRRNRATFSHARALNDNPFATKKKST